MSAKKLSDADKKEILEQYRQLGETTLTIANRYGVSNSTISRMLKNTLPPDEYEALIQQKRSTRIQGSLEEESLGESSDEVFAPPVEVAPVTVEKTSNARSEKEAADLPRRRKKRSSVSAIDLDTENDLDDFDDGSPAIVNEEDEKVDDEAEAIDLDGDDLDGDDFDADDDLDLDDDDFDEDDEEEFDEADGDEEGGLLLKQRRTRIIGQMQVLPFDRAILPKTCYLVVDRSAELITRPLREFGDLGQIPVAEIQERTLPVFDNHRVARRFANRSQRVMKIPDSKMLQRVSSYLQAKGITRILVDGQVYSL
jgi:transposase-like protein